MAAKSAIDTASNEGEDNDVNVIEWLKSKRLNKLVNYVEENELTIDDFLTYNEEDMELRSFF